MFGGYADGSIRRWDIKDNNCTLHIQTSDTTIAAKSIEDQASITETLVWSLKLVSDEYLVSGDSHGHLKVWDTKHGTLVQTFN